MAFLRHYDIQLPCSLRWRADLNQGILCVNLDGPATPTTSNRAKTPLAPDLSLVPSLVDNRHARHYEDDDDARGAATS
ncbi:MAG: hypothetical protein M3O28_01455 [Actinomycetota bacterium]|nr:hypothetical protein [Actinomycetota bacterium]